MGNASLGTASDPSRRLRGHIQSLCIESDDEIDSFVSSSSSLRDRHQKRMASAAAVASSSSSQRVVGGNGNNGNNNTTTMKQNKDEKPPVPTSTTKPMTTTLPTRRRPFNDSFWNSMWELDVGEDEFFAAFGWQDVVTMREDALDNLEELVIRAGGVLRVGSQDGVLNAARTFRRVAGFLFEIDAGEIIPEDVPALVFRRLMERPLCRSESGQALLWTPLFGQGDEALGVHDSDPDLNLNRVELLKTLLVLCSERLWREPVRDFARNASDSSNPELVSALVRSMLGVICSAYVATNPTQASSSKWKSSDETWLVLADACVSTLVALLDSEQSQLWEAVSDVVRTHAETMCEALVNILDASCSREALVLLWRLVDVDSEFRSSIVGFPHVACDMLVPRLLQVVWDHRRVRGVDTAIGSVQLASFVLLALTNERDFAVSLNRLVVERRRSSFVRLSAEANHADLIVAVIHKVVFDGDKLFEPLWRVLFTILLNVSPFIKTLGKDSGAKLVSLFQKFSSPGFLFAAEDNHQYLFFLLEIFGNLIQYQGQGHTHLLYALVRSKGVVDELVRLTVPITIIKKEDTNGQMSEKNNNSKKKPVFYPSEVWLQSWKSRLPMTVVNLALAYLEPMLVRHAETNTSTEMELLDLIEDTTLVGILPVPHPLVLHRYRRSPKTDAVVRVFFWSSALIRASESDQNPWEGIDEKRIKLFTVTVSSS